jgi:hypothetical protein
MLCTALLVLIGFAQLASAQFEDTDSFSLLMQGTCVSGQSTGSCTLKGNSQTIQTLISPSDALIFTVKPHLGSYAHLTMNWATDSSGISIQGNMTFGTHTARDHTIIFETHGEVTNSKDTGFSASAGRITDGMFITTLCFFLICKDLVFMLVMKELSPLLVDPLFPIIHKLLPWFLDTSGKNQPMLEAKLPTEKLKLFK